MAAKKAFFTNEANFSFKVAYLICFDLLRMKICFINIFGEELLVKRTKYAYIHAQRVKISPNRHFVFIFTSLPVLTFFSTVILTGS